MSTKEEETVSGLSRPAVSGARAPRIYWITEEFPPDCGAIGFVVERLAVSLEQRGFAMNVIARQTRPPSPRQTRSGGVSVRRIRPAGRLKGAGWRALPAMAGFLARLVWLLASEARRYDIVLLSGMKIMPAAVVPVCRALGKMCVIRLESPFELLEPIAAESLDLMGGASAGPLSGARRRLSRALAWLLGVLQRAAVVRADRIVAISSELVERLRAAGCRPTRILQIPNGTDLERFAPVTAPAKRALRERLGLPSDRTLALYAGRLSRAKGVLMMIESWPALLEGHPDLHLVVVGSGRISWDDCEAEMHARAHALGLDARVSFVGETDQVREYLQAADFFVLPSEYEGFSLAIGEALACGLPVVVTTVGAAPELIESGVNGFLFPPKDARAMLEALSRCLAERARWPEIGRRARQSMEPYGLARVADRYAALLRELAQGPGGARTARTAPRATLRY